jgi:hypothetical protein
MQTNQHPIGSGLGAHTTAREAAGSADLSGKLVVITGGYAGLGLETTRVLAERGAEIIAGARDVGKAKQNLATVPRATLRPLDLSVFSFSHTTNGRRTVNRSRPTRSSPWSWTRA